jgi:hypothetical protein
MKPSSDAERSNAALSSPEITAFAVRRKADRKYAAV